MTHHLTAIVLAVVSVSGTPAPRPDFDRGKFVRWIRHYEGVMGTRRHLVTFLEPGAVPLYDSCAYSGRGPWVELNMNCSPEFMLRVEGLPIAEREIARHEVCHEALGHHEDERPLAPEVRGKMESDALECEARYP